MEVQRGRLCEIVLRRAPRLVVISAPAGYGKSTFVRQLLAQREGSAVCDCLAVREEIDFARAMLAALAAARPALADAIAQAQLGASDDPRSWAAVAYHFWSGSEPRTFVFENAEALARCARAAALFERLIRIGDRVVIVCSRDVVPVPYGRGVDPMNVVTFGIEDLRFNPDEIRVALCGPKDSKQQAAIEQISRGWPIVVALLARAAQERPLAEVLASLGTVVHDELLVYLASEVIGRLSERERTIAFILSALPDASYFEISRVWPSITPDDIDGLALRVPLSRTADGILRLHPVLRQLFHERAGTQIAHIVERAARAAQGHGDETRAAELYLTIGDKLAAANALRKLGAYIVATPTPRLAAVFGQFDEKTLRKFPALWCSTLIHRGYSIPPYEWLRSVQAIWNGLPADVEPDVRASVLSSLLNAHTNIGLCTRAAELLEEQRAALGDSAGWAVATLWSAALDSHNGRYDRIPEYTKMLTPVLDASDLTHALYLYDIISPIARSRGEWDRDAEILRRSRELFDRTPHLGVSLLGLVESAFAQWFAGNDEQCDAFVAELQLRVTAVNERGHRFFIACARGIASDVPYGYEKAKTRAQGLLIASARAQTRDAARRFASHAVLVADRSERRYLRVIARCAAALLDDTRREVLLKEALSISASLDSQPMRVALTALLADRSEAGMLASFAAQYLPLRAGTNSIKVRVLRGETFVENKLVTLSRSELAVLIALAQEPRAFSVCELGDHLFADLDADKAGNRLYVYVHRLRQRLGRDAVIVDETGYRLGTGVDVDLWQLNSLTAKVQAGEPTSKAEISRLLAVDPLSLPELEALALRLRLPEHFMRRLRDGRSRLLGLRQDPRLSV